MKINISSGILKIWIETHQNPSFKTISQVSVNPGIYHVSITSNEIIIEDCENCEEKFETKLSTVTIPDQCYYDIKDSSTNPSGESSIYKKGTTTFSIILKECI